MPQEDFFPKELKELSFKNAPEFSYYYFEEYLNKLSEKGYLTSQAKIKNRATSLFKFYSDENCQVFKEGKLVCILQGMSDEPYYLPVPRKGQYRFKSISDNGKKMIIDSIIDNDEEKIIYIKRGKTDLKKYILYLNKKA